MKSMKLVFFVLLVIPQFSSGKMFLEPYVGLAKLQVKALDTEYYDISDGFFLGIKGGFDLNQKFFVGADYHTGGPYKFGPPLQNSEWNHNMFGGGIGADYKVIRFWGGYYMSNTYDDRAESTRYLGTAYKIGFGLLASSKIRCNLDLIYSDITKVSFLGVEEEFANFKISSSHVSISIPIDL